MYLHIAPDSLSSDVVVGETVQRGQPLADAGNTGWANANHLHFQVQKNPCDAANVCPQGRCTLEEALRDVQLAGGGVRKAGCAAGTGWWFTTTRAWKFSDADVIKQQPSGVPVVGSYTSDNEPPKSTSGASEATGLPFVPLNFGFLVAPGKPDSAVRPDSIGIADICSPSFDKLTWDAWSADSATGSGQARFPRLRQAPDSCAAAYARARPCRCGWICPSRSPVMTCACFRRLCSSRG